MGIIQLALAALSLGGVATASFAGNLNYRSPSLNHPDLGISIRKVNKRNNYASTFKASDLKFTHGIASGDPYPDSVILWTRVSPEEDNSHSNVTVSGTVPLYDHDNDRYVKVSTSPICVEYKVTTDKNLTKIVSHGQVYTSSDVDYTVKVEATGLKPFSTYYYQFNVCDSSNKSPVGRTKTTPTKNQTLSKGVNLAVYSCSNYRMYLRRNINRLKAGANNLFTAEGFFNAYGNVVRKDSADYVIHLGDYIYEYANGAYGWGNEIDRIPQPDKDLATLYDYRRRYATYRTDVDLLESHQNFPWIAVWDDHEVQNNEWKAGSSNMNNTESSFIADGGVSVDSKKANAVRAYFEWLPVRQVDMDDNLRIWRTFNIGSLFDLIMLDTRQYDRSITDLSWNTEYLAQIANDQSRSIMGARQEAWFYKQLISSQQRDARWRIIGNQIIFSRMNESLATGASTPFNYDEWDGYVANRNRTLKTILENNITNTVFLAGDSHASWVSDLVWFDHGLPYDPATGAGAIGVEFAGSAVSSPAPIQNITMAYASFGSNWLLGANEELQWQDLYYRGYFELNIDYERIKADFYGIPDIKTRNGKEIKLASFEVLDGENKLNRDPTVGGGVAYAGALRNGKIVNGTVVDTNPA
ncbi:PhoD-like phosphatase-domain-containing protein [Sphaerosporella brunnea]|uniref:PhoD-like phosphatase-domain-containing protein n=1 Tax=Sphaerosporella brunnea TaxID=1250544 RepID=A0A5J5EDY6_9PEZI|nr:PhoD-like phosphatase-domain-containing protein [Sphaerosporella brunnea]